MKFHRLCRLPAKTTASLATAALLGATHAPVQAQSSVQLYGMIDLGVGRFQRPEEQVGANTAVTRWNKIYKLDRNNEQTSYWGMSGKESLGGDLAAVFKIEAFFQPDTGGQGRFTGDTYFARDSYVGLQSKSLGEVRLGRNTTQMFTAGFLHNAFGSAFGWSPTMRHIYSGGEGKIRGDSGWSNSVAYYTPLFAGFNGGAVVAAGEGDTGNGGGGIVKAYSAGAGYVGGPFSANLVYQDVQPGNTNGVSQKATMAGASFNAGFARFQAQYTYIDDKPSGFEDQIAQVSVVVPLGKSSLLLSYGIDKTDSTADTKLQTLALGYRYDFSKRTDVTVALMREEQDAGRTAFKTYTRDITGNSYGVGLRHRF